jgi:acyl-[acyl-carrier-protein]-phospholipid O-acyltransferase/long-chain-fatty-acid--[acyl-carrier-protein] ligase
MCVPAILKTRRFLPLFLTQFLGAFNDNVFKNALVMLIAYRLAAQTGGNAQMLVTLAAALFILPFLLFSATAGQVADKYDRSKLARYTKIAEIILMVIASAGFYLGNIYFLLFVLFCTGIQATFFGPIKYALLPQHLRENELITGNAWIEAGTFLAILIGTILGGLLVMQEAGIPYLSVAMIGIAIAGYMASRHIPPATAPMPSLKLGWNLTAVTCRMISHDRKNRRVFQCIWGISWFWLVGATFLSQFPTYAKDVIHADETVVTLFLTVFSVGIGIGSFLCSQLLKGKVSSAHVPVAAVGISLFTVDLFFASGNTVRAGGYALMDVWRFLEYGANWRILFDLLATAICGGIYIVPLYAILQHESDPLTRARTIASNNVINALFMVASALATMGMLKMTFTIPQIFLTLAICNGLVVLYLLRMNRN